MRVICESPGFEHHPGLVCTEWMNLIAIVEIIRSLTGPSWQPKEITLISRLPAHDAARETFPNTRILPASPRTSILVPRAVLARPSPILSPTNDPAAEPGQSADACEAAPLDPLHMLREIVKPYLRDTPLKLSEMAELLGTSERTLQRQLGALGTSYSRLVAEARYQVACDLLAGEDMTITDVAMCLGYQNPTHFSRAFRQLAGLSPTAYRASLHAPA